jgi:hypothetical protein
MTTFKGVQLHTYTDPFPGLKSTDKVQVDCADCGGDGVYHAPSGYSIRNPRTGYGFKGCFACNGYGHVTRTVQSRRRNAMQHAWFAEYGQAIADAEREANWAAQRAAEQAEAWDEAHVEQVRRAALVTGFVGEVGAKVSGLAGTVAVAKYFAGAWNRSSSMFVVINLDNGQVVKMFGSSESLFSVERGDHVTITGATVKAHESYKGQDQSVLMRVKVAVDVNA